MLVHRKAWIDLVGPIPDGMFVCHSCDNPPCYNIEHLFLGSQRDNMSDAAKKLRTQHGESHRQAKLNENDVMEMRDLAGHLSQREIARLYGVAQSVACQAINGKTWKHVVCSNPSAPPTAKGPQ